ncbi:MAG TPA: SDR family NAD(P)-dependent oxidoreductase [Stackebrandtia sp.]|jgi:NAD(P)-dependent dehydrogenase (short-subunit alcohol dehydrogenase family)|uniref:SDR family NAD(P)-dependent oxidoreductase n=1 Tax=Stackebrandtia sp. TaxID=2023065 RepID=UPI002D64A677|nr:SDR family NAD(P)-dependent oxidoreductase [Stackebrandtia sp.]HZE39686.1 SDR family NAD(P)-dependent oxidoreductase [Stackebrandtia sp.]
MDLQLSGKVAVVTGASKGLGLAITRTLLSEGATVVAVSRKTSPQLDALASESLLHVAADLTDPDAPSRVVARAVEAFGGVDVLVNNAGGPPPGASLPRFGFATPNDDDWRAMFEFNLYSAVRAIRAAVPELVKRGGGAIVNVSSTMARQPGAMNVDYGAAKAALNHVTKSVSEEFGSRGVRANTVSPGPVLTAWWTEDGGAADILAGATGADRDAVIESVGPEMMRLTTGRFADPQEVADVVALLASPRSGSTTGADFVVDSGALKEV